MQPNTPMQEPPQSPMDYLNQISTPTPQKTLNPIVLWAAIGSVIVIAIVVFMMVLSSGTGNNDRITTIAAQLNALKTVSKDATENIQGSDLRTLNSNFSLTMTNVTRDMTDTVTTLGGSTDENNSKVVVVTNDTKAMTDRLEDARLNSTYDRTYAREMAYYLKKLHTEMSELYTSTQSESAHTFLKKADSDISSFTESFANYNGS